MNSDTDTLTHEDCIKFGDDTPCVGTVEYCSSPFTGYGCYAYCDAHYAEADARAEELRERERRYQESLYCKHGTYVGDAWGPDYLCWRCESE